MYFVDVCKFFVILLFSDLNVPWRNICVFDSFQCLDTFFAKYNL